MAVETSSAVGSLVPASSSNLMPPPPPSRPKRGPVVLDEDSWTDQIEAIVQRDFFPDLPKLQSKLEWLQAVRSGDPQQVRQAQLNIQQRRAGIRTPVGASPATFATPGMTSMLRTPAGWGTPSLARAATPAAGGAARPDTTGQEPAAQAGPAHLAPAETLDHFMARHTSEDNASFAEVLDASNKRRHLAKPWLFEDKNQPLLLERPQEQDGYGTTGAAVHQMVGWRYVPKNRLFYDASQQAEVPLTDAELAQQVKGAPKAIRHANTRFRGASGTAGSSTPDVLAGMAASPTPPPGSVVSEQHPVLATPSFAPGVEESPFITWGELEGTPLRLDQEDTPLDIGGSGGAGPRFRVPEAPRRDAVGRAMSQRAATSLKRKAATRLTMPLNTALPGTPGRTPGRTPTLSAAGLRLASSLRGTDVRGVDAADRQLRASYAGTPNRAALPSGTPRTGASAAPTPSPQLNVASTSAAAARIAAAAARAGGHGSRSAGRNAAAAASWHAGVALGSHTGAKGSVTDDLLDILTNRGHDRNPRRR